LARFLRLITCSFGIALFVWASVDHRFRASDGTLKAEFCLPVAAGLALILLGIAASGRWIKPAVWLAVAVVGQAAALQMIDAGQLIRYQHYRPLSRLLETSPWLLIILTAQTVLVVGGIRPYWPVVSAWARRNFKIWQLLGMGLIFFLTSATVSREVRAYLVELPFAAFVQAVNLANVILAVCSIPPETVGRLKLEIEGLVGRSEKSEAITGGIDRFAVVAAVWVTVVAAMLNFFSYERHPHIPDEVVYIYHARYLAAGMLTLPAPPVQQAFDIDLMNYEADRWFCPVPPGWPLILALGVLFHASWLVNPILAGLNVLLAYLLVRELYDRRTARLATLLLCTSPWHIFMAMNFMTHTFTLTCALVAAVAVAWARRAGSPLWAVVSGVATGAVSLIRPLEGVVVAGLIGLWIIGVGGKRLKISGLAAFAFGVIAVGGIAMPYNKLLTGSPTKFPIMAYTDKYYGPKSNALGFGPDRGLGWELDPHPGHGPLDATINSNLNTFSLNIELFGWGAGSLLFIALLIFAGAVRGNDYLMLAVIVAIFAVHFFYWYSGGPDFGARYWYLMLLPCVVLTVRGIQYLENKLGRDPAGGSVGQPRVAIFALSLCALALVNYFPWRAIDKYHHYLRMRPDVRYLAEDLHFGKSLVLIRGNRHPDYESAAVYNPLDLRADAPVYAWDRNPEVREQTLKVYADRPVWILDGPTITGQGFKVVAGPLSAEQLLKGDGTHQAENHSADSHSADSHSD